MNGWQWTVLRGALGALVVFLLVLVGFPAFLLLGAFTLLGIGFFVGWTSRGDEDMAQWIYGLRPPPDDEPPERVRA